MATSSETNLTTTVKVKLLIDSKGQRVLFGQAGKDFAEAGKDFADFLFTLLSLPVATVIRLLSTAGMVGTLGTLYQSFASLSDAYMEPTANKATLLRPAGPVALLQLDGGDSPPFQRVYVCPMQYNCGRRHSSDDPRAVCPTCNRNTSMELPYVAPPPVAAAQAPAADEGGSGRGGGFVKGVVTYMVMEDLEVKPMSTISSIVMLNKFNVKEVGALEEKIVSIGLNEGVKLLKASLQTKNVLTAVFMGK